MALTDEIKEQAWQCDLPEPRPGRPCSPSLFVHNTEDVRRKKERENLGLNPQAPLGKSLALLRVQKYAYAPPSINDSSLKLRSSRHLTPSLLKSDKKSRPVEPKLVGLHHQSTLGSLVSPLRRVNPEDNWSPHEIATFEAAICSYGKRFHSIQRMVKTKTTREVVSFYYVWKKTENYCVWKRSFHL
mmetsp:Transcript_19781/g.36669  ORF Transcript_19781/g.36669 Transcript_19781/m.36669 type:complete len:186 (+) Transcript_19781:98-655(+)